MPNKIVEVLDGVGREDIDPKNFNPEHLWGGEEYEWKNWETAVRDMSLVDYATKQQEEALGFKTHEAFLMLEGRSPNNNDEQCMFFVEKGGARFFKRRFFQHRNDVDAGAIKKYYTNREWETKETDTHA